MQEEQSAMIRPTWFYMLKEIQRYVKPSDWQVEVENVEDCLLFVITAGSGRLIINGAGFQLKQGKCYIVKRGLKTRIMSGEESLSFYQLAFGLHTVESTAGSRERGARPDPFPCQGEVSCRPFSRCLDYVEAIYRQRYSEDEMVVFDNHVRFQELLRFFLEQNLPVRSDINLRQAVQYSLEYVKRHYRNMLTVNQLAELADVSRWQYTRLCKELIGQVPLDYLNGIRIDKAKQLLSTTADRLVDIAQSVGFHNEYYFNRRFKQTVGVSPGQYRRSQQESIRVFAPFLEDYVVALGVTPVVQCYHALWGKQDYLGLQHVPLFDVAAVQADVLSQHRPDVIVLDGGFERWMPFEQLNRLAPTHNIAHPLEQWRTTLRMVADLVGKQNVVQDVIAQYEEKAREARIALHRSVHGRSVACLRISARGISLYGGPAYGYTGPVLYRALELTPHPLVLQLASRARKVALTPEWLQRLDADRLFVTFDRRHSVMEGEERKILDSSLWRALPAVKNNCVYEVDFLSWMNYGVLSNSRKIDDVLKVLA